MRGRDKIALYVHTNREISIHAPRAGARRSGRGSHRPVDRFQSTRPVRGRDEGKRAKGQPTNGFQSTRPVRGRDACQRIRFFSCFNFNPRAPCGGATRHRVSDGGAAVISIHAPRAGARLTAPKFMWSREDFNPRAPCGGATRIGKKPEIRPPVNFNPRAPCGGATGSAGGTTSFMGISIHAPRAGARLTRWLILSQTLSFQSTRPVRGRDPRGSQSGIGGEISIHAPRAGARHLFLLFRHCR